MAKIIVKDGQIVSQDGSQLKFENTPISGTTAEFTSITAQNLNVADISLEGVVKTTNENQTIDGTKTFLNDVLINDLTVGKGNNSFTTNTVLGNQALAAAAPYSAGRSTNDSENNVSIGYNSLNSATQVKDTTAIGNLAGSNATLSFTSTFLGSYTGNSILQSIGNTFIGTNAGKDIGDSNYNSFVGFDSDVGGSGSFNSFFGSFTGISGNGSNNLFLGAYAGENIVDINDTTIISNGTTKERLRIDSSGNVSIGDTTSYSYKLFVNGSFKASSVDSPYANIDGVFVGSNGIEVDGDINANSNIYGDGSGLTSVNAALLNSQPGSYYLDYANFTGTPPSPNDAIITIQAGDGLQTGGDFTTNQSVNETITLNVDDTVVRTTGDQTIGGTKTFTSTIQGNISGNSTNADTATKLATARTISISGDVVGSTSFDGSVNVGITSTLSNTGVTAGTYRSVTVNAKGLITGGTNPTTADEYNLTDVVKTTNVNQTIDGTKTFVNDIEVNSLTVGKGNNSLTYNTALGVDVLSNAQQVNSQGGDIIPGYNGSADYNVGIGYEALKSATNGVNDVAIGYRSFANKTTGAGNVAIGYQTGLSAINGNGTSVSANVFVGYEAGKDLTSGQNNIFIGPTAGTGITQASDTVSISCGPGKERLRIDSSGNVMIGTTTPLGKLAVNGDIWSLGNIFSIGYIETNGQIIANGGFSGDINAGDISSGTLAIARIADNSIINAKLQNDSITINGQAATLGSSITIETSGIDDIIAGDGISAAIDTVNETKTLSVNNTVVRTSGDQTINGTLTATEFDGDGSSLFYLNASNLSSGTIPIDRITDGSITNAKLLNNYVTINGTQVQLGGDAFTFNELDDLVGSNGVAIEFDEQAGYYTAQADSTVVRVTGNQTIGGRKTFQYSSTAGNTTYDIGTVAVFENNNHGYITFLNPSTKKTGLLFKDSGDTSTYAGAILYDHNTDSLDFRTNGATRMYVDNGGDIGIGTTTTNARLEIKQKSDSAGGGIRLVEQSSTSYWDIFLSDTAPDNRLDFSYGGTNKAYVDTSGNLTVAGTITELSTRKVKKNIRSLGSQLNKIKKLNPVSYRRKEIKDSKKEMGFISEEVKEVYPELVNGEGVNYSKMVSILVSAVKELTEKVEQQEKQIKDLKRMVR